jgi:hypothetical protein
MSIDEKFSAKFRWTDDLGNYNYSIVDTKNLETELEKLAAELYEEMAINARAAQLINTGSLLDPKNFKAKITDYKDGKQTLDIYLIDYYDYINQGVMGYKSKKPDSPYKFKDSFTMSPEGRLSIMNWLKNNRDIKLDKKKKDIVGLEGKDKSGSKKKITRSALEIATDEAIAGIKSGGIKRTDYFTNAANKVFANLTERIGAGVIKDLKVKLILTNNKLNTRV